MPGLQVRAFSEPDESRRPDKTRVDVVRLGANTAARLTLVNGRDDRHVSTAAGLASVRPWRSPSSRVIIWSIVDGADVLIDKVRPHRVRTCSDMTWRIR